MEPAIGDGTRALSLNGGVTATDVDLTASMAINKSDPARRIRSSGATIHAGWEGAVTDGGSVVIDNALIDLMGADNTTGLDANNPNAGTADKEIDARHVTIVNGSANSRGCGPAPPSPTPSRSP